MARGREPERTEKGAAETDEAARARRIRAAWREVARLEGMLGMPVPLDEALGLAPGLHAAMRGGGRALFPAPCIDIPALERMLEARGGAWEGSMADRIERRHGAVAVAIIARLLEIGR